MKPAYLKLSDNREVRIFFNMNALCEVTALTGIEMNDLAGGRADIKTLRAIAWCSAVEGEAAEGKELGLTLEQFGRLMTMECIVEFSKILTEQSTNSGQKKSEAPHKSPLMFFRKQG